MNTQKLLQAFDAWRHGAGSMVLATVYETAGSTYSKAGAQMLIGPGGHFRGMLSGGCLEGDLAERAARVMESGRPEAVTYDLGQNDEALWGLGVGCDGLMRIFLQPLTSAGGYQPFVAMRAVYEGDRAGVAMTVIESGVAGLAAGDTAVHADHGTFVAGDARRLEQAFGAEVDECRASGNARTVTRALQGGTVTALVAPLAPPPRILVLGGGLDAEPLVRLVGELGWRVVVQDHRPAYIDKGDFSGAEQVLNCAARELHSAIDFTRFGAAVVMSHHLETDRVYLQQLAATAIPYIGLLGPIDRRRRLLGELGAAADDLRGRVHGPAGLDLGGRGPAAIALSIVAQLHPLLVG